MSCSASNAPPAIPVHDISVAEHLVNMRVAELPPDVSPSFQALLPVHLQHNLDRDAGGQHGMLLTRKRNAAALILPPHKHPTHGATDAAQANHNQLGGCDTEQYYGDRSSSTTSPDLHKSYKLVEPSCKAVSFGTAPRWGGHLKDTAGSDGLATSTRPMSNTGSRRQTCDAATPATTPEPYSAEWWLLRTAEAAGETTTTTRAGSSSRGRSSSGVRSSSTAGVKGGKDTSDSAGQLVMAPLYAGAGGAALQPGTLAAVASMDDVSAPGPVDQRPSQQQQQQQQQQQPDMTRVHVQQLKRCSRGGPTSSDGTVGTTAGGLPAAAVTMPRSRCALFPRERRFPDQRQDQQQQQQQLQPRAAEVEAVATAAGAATGSHAGVLPPASSSRQAGLTDVVKHRAPAVCFARPSVRQQMQQLLEQRRKDREAAQAAEADRKPAAPAAAPPCCGSSSSSSSSVSSGKLAIEMQREPWQQQEQQPTHVQEQQQVQQGELCGDQQQQCVATEQQLVDEPHTGSSCSGCSEAADVPGEEAVEPSRQGNTTDSLAGHAEKVPVTDAGGQLGSSAAADASLEGPVCRGVAVEEATSRCNNSPSSAPADTGREQSLHAQAAFTGGCLEESSTAHAETATAQQEEQEDATDLEDAGPCVLSKQQQQQQQALEVDMTELQTSGVVDAGSRHLEPSQLERQQQQQEMQQQEEQERLQQDQNQAHDQAQSALLEEQQVLQEQQQVVHEQQVLQEQQQVVQEEQEYRTWQEPGQEQEEDNSDVQRACTAEERSDRLSPAAAAMVSSGLVSSGEAGPLPVCSSSSSNMVCIRNHGFNAAAAATTAVAEAARRPTTPVIRGSRSPGAAAALLGPGSFAPNDLHLSYRRRSSAWSFGSGSGGPSGGSSSPRGAPRCPSSSPLRCSVLQGSPLRGSSSGSGCLRTSPQRGVAGRRSVTFSGAEDAASVGLHQTCKEDACVLMHQGGTASPEPQHHQQSSSSSSSHAKRGSALAEGASSWTFADVAPAQHLVRKRVPGPIILPPHGSSRTRVGGPSTTGVALGQHAAVIGGDAVDTAAAAAAATAAIDGSDVAYDKGRSSSGSSIGSTLLQPSWALVEPRVRGVPLMRPSVNTPAASGPATETSDASLVSDPWQLDAAIRSSKPSWSFPRAPLSASQQHNTQTLGDSRPLVVLEVQEELLHPRRGLGVLAFGLGASRWCEDNRTSQCRAACITVYDVEAAWNYLSKHAPGFNIALTSGRHHASATPSSAAIALSGCVGLGGGQGQEVTPLSLEQLAAAVAATKPRAPMWDWGPVAVVRPSIGPGPVCKGQQQYYDVSWVLVRKRAAGCAPFGVQLFKPGDGQGRTTGTTALGPGAYNPCYTHTQRQTALQVHSFLLMLGRQDLPAAHQPGDAGDASGDASGDLVTAADAWLRPRTKACVDMAKTLSREAAEQLQARGRLLTSQIPLPDADLGDVLRPRVPQVHIMDASEEAGGLDPSSALGPGYYDPTEPSAAAAAAGPDFSRTMGRCGACPETLKATAAAAAGADSVSSGSAAPSLHTLADWFASRRSAVAAPVTVLEPQWQAVKPKPLLAFIQPLPKHAPPMPTTAEEGQQPQQQQLDAGAWQAVESGAGAAPAKGCLDWSRMTARKPVQAACAAPHADYRVEDIPLTLLAQHMSTTKTPTFATMTGRPDPAAAKQPPGDLADALAIGATHDQAAAWLAATRGRAAAAAAGAGPDMAKQAGRQHQVDATGAVIGARQAEDGMWVDYNPRWGAVKPRVGCAVLFDLQVDREVAARHVPGAAPDHYADTW